MVDNLKSKLFDPASITLTDRTTLNVFSKGDTPFMTNWNFAWAALADSAQSQVAGKVGLVNNPGTKAANVTSISCRGGGGFGIGTASKAKDAAWEMIGLVTSLTKPENDVAKLKAVSALPVHASVWSDATVLKDYPQMAEMIKQVPYVEARPALPWYTEFSKIVQVELTSALAGSKTPKAALDDAVAQAQSKGSAPVA
jgi:multiple sugar transport system substrate-binding protein